MYSKFLGTISDITSSTITMMPRGSGVGYELYVSPLAFALASKVGDGGECLLWAYHHRTDVSELLFGFGSPAEKTLFLTLLKVSGIGAKSALSLLSLGVDTIVSAIAAGDDKVLASVSGIGKKGALKIIVELKGSIKNFDNLDAPQKGKAPISAQNLSPEQEACAALTSLGYDRSSVERALASCLPGQDLDSLIREAITKLAYRP